MRITCFGLCPTSMISFLLSFADRIKLSTGDMIKFDLGCFIDGYIAVAAHTLVIGEADSPGTPLSGIKADVLQAAHIASEVAIKLLQPGNTNSQVTSAISKVANNFGVRPISGVLSHQMKRFVIDGNKVILQREEADQKVENYKFEVNEVYAVDIAMSSGDGKPREAQSRTTVFKRAVWILAQRLNSLIHLHVAEFFESLRLILIN